MTFEPTPAPAPMVPPVLYLPLSVTSTPEEQLVEIRELKDGRRALLAYTALDRLLELAGERQPWVLVRTEDLGQIKAAQPYDVVIFDLDVPASYRRNGAIA
ncbi:MULTISPECIES: SAV_915 family protein [Microbacterium]|uniref:SAV_915 family protein n=1 Tax=Microbacterium TaxID=33882 RepID=UPI0028A15E31|nr:SAV_915 family protein [Microbacterium sp.]